MGPHKELPTELSGRFVKAMMQGVDGFPIVDWYLNGPTEPQTITRDDRIQGLAALWAEAKVSFAYWDNVPDLDWDKAFHEFLPRVVAAEDPVEYYRVLTRFTALLCDGHSYVNPPPWVRSGEAPPLLGVRALQGEMVVERGEGLPPGTVITHIGARPVSELLSELAPYEFAGNEPARLNRACRRALLGAQGSSVALATRLPDGRPKGVSLVRNGPADKPPAVEREDLGRGRVLLRINTWADPSVVMQFNEAVGGFEGINDLIVDLRRNGGGNSAYGEKILARLIAAPVPGLLSKMPLHWGAMSVINLHRPVLVVRERHIEPDKARPRFRGQIAVLTGPDTYSASEDFCALFRLSERGLIVGESTGGSTGNPSVIRLPGGGVGAICATRTTFPDGTAFVGKGIQPDVAAAPTLRGLAAGQDEVLQEALGALA